MKPDQTPGRLSEGLRNPWYWLAAGLFVVYIRGLFLDVMDVDASQYASISMEMLQNGHWLEVQHRHADYLDKPPLLFWVSASSFALFGLHNWAYKLPSVLAALLGIYATYRFCLLYYPKNTARHAAFILASSVGALMLCNDVRTDTLLMAITACAVWQLGEWLNPTPNPTPKGEGGGDGAVNSTSPLPFRGGVGGGVYRHLFLAAIFVGLAMLAKGPIGLIAPAFAVGAHLLLRRHWRRLFDWRWLTGLTLALLVLAPMCWGLYRQYDLHPEKTVNGRTGVSGLYFFFWEQSFGRITGENVWKNDTSAFYFLHVYLWAFLPWPFLFVGALWQRLRHLWVQKFKLPATDEAFSIGGFVLTFAALSMSQYKLPHYIFITLPWAAILTARWLVSAPRVGLWAQLAVYLVLALTSFLLLGFVFPTTNLLLWAIPTGVFGYLGWQSWRTPVPIHPDAAVQRGILAFLGAAFVLNFHFYPELLPYQSTSAVPRYARARQIPTDRLAVYHRHGHALDFYSGRILPALDTPEAVRQKALGSGDYWLYTDARGFDRLDSAGVTLQETARFSHFQVALLKPAFLLPATRPEALDTVFLLKILAQQH